MFQGKLSTIVRSPLVALCMLCLATALAGCESMGGGAASDAQDSGLVGTWAGDEDATDTPLQFASVTFAGDGTYTAGMRYEGQLRTDSGKWRTDTGRLMLDEDRNYIYAVQGDSVVFTDPRLNVSVTLQRLR